VREGEGGGSSLQECLRGAHCSRCGIWCSYRWAGTGRAKLSLEELARRAGFMRRGSGPFKSRCRKSWTLPCLRAWRPKQLARDLGVAKVAGGAGDRRQGAADARRAPAPAVQRRHGARHGALRRSERRAKLRRKACSQETTASEAPACTRQC
jgi:hypothetical protein